MIVYSYDIFAAQAAGGVSRSMIELMRALPDDDFNWRLWAGEHENDLLRAAMADPRFASHVDGARYMAAAGRIRGAIANEPGFARDARAQRTKLVHRTYYPFLDLLSRRGIARVETLHDMWDERAEKGRSNRLKSMLKRRALNLADAIVCVSQSTRDELTDIWPSLSDRAVVIPHGVRPLSAHPRDPARHRPFFLFVGRRGTYKNFDVAVEALRQASCRDHDLICFGGGAFDEGERASIDLAGLTSRVLHYSGDDDVLAGFYEAATALIYPSRYEGFGLPLLEAMIHGCPVVAAPLTSLPEVGGDAAVYADPSRPDSWAEAITMIADDAGARAEMRHLGKARAAMFSWTGSAQRHVALYRDLA